MSTALPEVDENRLLDTEEVAEMLGMRPGTVENWRYKENGPPYVKLGRNGRVRYRATEVKAWVGTYAESA